ncbi:MAG: ribosome biogenesis GTPase [Woeseiaceae bacterium]|jgi:ribosome biogenesis GTPase
MSSSNLAELGWDSFFVQQFAADSSSALIPVRIMNVQKSGLQVLGENIHAHIQLSGSDHELHVTVGDWLLVDEQSHKIERLLERKSLFKRRAPGSDRQEQFIAANVDTLFIVSSCNDDFNEARLERYLAIAREAQVMVIIILTKADLAENSQEYVSRAARLAPALTVEAVNSLQRENLDCLQPWLGNGQTVALLGSSGVGKSTLTNSLLGEQQLATQEIREGDAKGRHTTTSRSMHHLPGGAWLLDTPGMRELQLTDVKAGLDDVFAEISALAAECKFADCGHEGEPGCAVNKAIKSGDIEQARLERWKKLVREEAHNSASIAERRSRDKGFGRLIKSVLKEKNARKGGQAS